MRCGIYPVAIITIISHSRIGGSSRPLPSFLISQWRDNKSACKPKARWHERVGTSTLQPDLHNCCVIARWHEHCLYGCFLLYFVFSLQLQEAWKMARNTYKYHFKKGNRIVHTGITDDLERREQEHKLNFGESGRIKKVGHATTLDAALRWEKEQAEKGRPTRRGWFRYLAALTVWMFPSISRLFRYS